MTDEQLLERDSPTHKDIDQSRAHVFCNVCGKAVQGELAAMVRWSHEHAETHSDQEHQETARRLGLAPEEVSDGTQ